MTMRNHLDGDCWFYAGPYVFSGVLYGSRIWPSWCHWLVPGTDPDDRAPFP